jgi:hypothetical protein
LAKRVFLITVIGKFNTELVWIGIPFASIFLSIRKSDNLYGLSMLLFTVFCCLGSGVFRLADGTNIDCFSFHNGYSRLNYFFVKYFVSGE